MLGGLLMGAMSGAAKGITDLADQAMKEAEEAKKRAYDMGLIEMKKGWDDDRQNRADQRADDRQKRADTLADERQKRADKNAMKRIGAQNYNEKKRDERRFLMEGGTINEDGSYTPAPSQLSNANNLTFASSALRSYDTQITALYKQRDEAFDDEERVDEIDQNIERLNKERELVMRNGLSQISIDNQIPSAQDYLKQFEATAPRSNPAGATMPTPDYRLRGKF